MKENPNYTEPRMDVLQLSENSVLCDSTGAITEQFGTPTDYAW